MEIFSNTFYIQSELSHWQLRDEIAELIYDDCSDFEIIIKEIERDDLIQVNEKDKYLKYLYEKDKATKK